MSKVKNCLMICYMLFFVFNLSESINLKKSFNNQVRADAEVSTQPLSQDALVDTATLINNSNTAKDDGQESNTQSSVSTGARDNSVLEKKDEAYDVKEVEVEFSKTQDINDDEDDSINNDEELDDENEDEVNEVEIDFENDNNNEENEDAELIDEDSNEEKNDDQKIVYTDEDIENFKNADGDEDIEDSEDDENEDTIEVFNDDEDQDENDESDESEDDEDQLDDDEEEEEYDFEEDDEEKIYEDPIISNQSEITQSQTQKIYADDLKTVNINIHIIDHSNSKTLKGSFESDQHENKH